MEKFRNNIRLLKITKASISYSAFAADKDKDKKGLKKKEKEKGNKPLFKD